MKSNTNYSTNEAWKILFDKYEIVEQIKEHKAFYITANEIKQYKEPRLMSKWDNSASLPEPLKKNKINILPVSRSKYVLSDFILYEPIPDIIDSVSNIKKVKIPEFESINIDNINSEANAINVLILSKILDDFLNVKENFATFNGRMGTGMFDFKVKTRTDYLTISVANAQCEIDGGFENEKSVVILEAKNVVKEDFHIRQLYYPYRLWSNRVKKPIRLVFSVYSNKIFRLFEYRFNEINNFSSIELIQQKQYSFEDTNITLDDISAVLQRTEVKYSDHISTTDIPFIQADSLDRIISLLENLYHKPKSKLEIATDIMYFTPRQSGYYYNAGRYIGLFETASINGEILIKLTKTAEELYLMNYKERQLKIVSLIVEHKLFNILLAHTLKNKELPSKEMVKSLMKELELNVASESVINRRSSSVLSWLDWIINLTKLNS